MQLPLQITFRHHAEKLDHFARTRKEFSSRSSSKSAISLEAFAISAL